MNTQISTTTQQAPPPRSPATTARLNAQIVEAEARIRAGLAAVLGTWTETKIGWQEFETAVGCGYWPYTMDRIERIARAEGIVLTRSADTVALRRVEAPTATPTVARSAAVEGNPPTQIAPRLEEANPGRVSDRAKAMVDLLRRHHVRPSLEIREAVAVAMAESSRELPVPTIVARLAQIEIALAKERHCDLAIDDAVRRVRARWGANESQ